MTRTGRRQIDHVVVERPPAPRVNALYAVLLALSPAMLAVIGWFSVRTVDNVEKTVAMVVKETSDLKVEVRGLKATMEAWAKQEFVPRTRFEDLRLEMERRIAALEKK